MRLPPGITHLIMKTTALTAILLLLAAAFPLRTPAQTPGAARTSVYVPLLKGKRVGLLSNHTGTVGNRHTLDVMLADSVRVTKLFSPEHGFRGTADAGERVASSTDSATGLPIVSLYGKRRRPLAEELADVDIVVSDMQDVGARFYTYYITMLEMMKAAAKAGKPMMVLDRPNPLGMTVDGPVLDMALASGVGKLPLPVIHGLTLGEMALMINGEGWLDGDTLPDLTVIACDGYTHSSRYELPVPPSPNLKSQQAILLYPSVCLFEGSVISPGRGTDNPFTLYGHPGMKSAFSFIPRSMPGARKPPLMGRVCYGRDLSRLDADSVIRAGFDLTYVIDAFNNLKANGNIAPDKILTPFFDKLVGNRLVRKMIMEGRSAEEIRATWTDEVKHFREKRKQYLIYPE